MDDNPGYLFHGKLLIPLLARTEAGFFMSLGPVEVVNPVTVKALQASLLRVAATGNPVVANPPGGKGFPKDPILKHFGVKGWSAFEKDAELWSIDCKDGICEIVPNRRRSDRGFEDDFDRKEILRVGSDMAALAVRLAELIATTMEERSRRT